MGGSLNGVHVHVLSTALVRPNAPGAITHRSYERSHYVTISLPYTNVGNIIYELEYDCFWGHVSIEMLYAT